MTAVRSIDMRPPSEMPEALRAKYRLRQKAFIAGDTSAAPAGSRGKVCEREGCDRPLWAGKRFCSRECGLLSRVASPAKVTLHCGYCGSSFEVYRNAAQRRKHCSRRCAMAARYGPDEEEQRFCEFCDEPIERGHKGAAYYKTRRFCSNSCHAQGDHPARKVTPREVRQIRRWARQGKTYRQIAARFGLSMATVGLIVRRESWTWVK